MAYTYHQGKFTQDLTQRRTQKGGPPRWIRESAISGAKGRARTGDRTIFSRVLYQLSYLGIILEVETRATPPVGDKGLEPLTSTV